MFEDLRGTSESTSIVQGAAGTGKTIVAIYMIKLLTDIGAAGDSDAFETDSAFSDFFLPDFRRHARGLRIGLVIPQQSLRKSVAEVFARTPGLSKAMVMSPFALGKSDEEFDVLFVDETHRLNRRANQASGMLNRDFRLINEKLFGSDADHWTQLDWVRAKSRHRILMIDSGQSVRPADLGKAEQRDLVEQAQREHRFHRLMTQMRVKSTSDYVGWIRAILSGERPAPIDLGAYDMRFFDDPVEMREAISARENEGGLARMAAGYGYRWSSRTDPSAWDVVAGDLRMRWNSKTVDWISSPGSADEVGSIHTLQGYDLNYAGVIIGPRAAVGRRSRADPRRPRQLLRCQGQGGQPAPRHRQQRRRPPRADRQHLCRPHDPRHARHVRARARSRPARGAAGAVPGVGRGGYAFEARRRPSAAFDGNMLGVMPSRSSPGSSASASATRTSVKRFMSARPFS
ncbi:DNA/RNA helicase domain-containing protein [Microbacterium indicum]|uniref:DNA/RNA helicase domain-containing protein n=1 Tax=Microbacterium indicum TaxID=358100 RepID=UPI003CCBA62F